MQLVKGKEKRMFRVHPSFTWMMLVYDFTLTKSGHSRKSTINIIKEKLPAYNLDDDDKNPRQTRSTTYALDNHHLLLDNDNALIASSEDEQEESQLYISYSADST